MYCEQAQSLFNAYLDGDLSPSLERELAAHRVKCADCRRELALMEVSGRLIESDEDPIELDDGFSDRLLACVDEQSSSVSSRWRSIAYIGSPLAAAAVVALAFIGVFDRGPGDVEVRGKKVTASSSQMPVDAGVQGTGTTDEPDNSALSPEELRDESARRALEDFFNSIRDNVSDQRGNVQTLRHSLDLTVRQWMDILNSRKNPDTLDPHFPGSDSRDSQGEPPTPERRGEIEDL